MLPNEMHWALVDTGAFVSFIDSDLANTLGLPIVDRTEVAGALGVGDVNVYLAQIYVADLANTVYGRFGGVNLSRIPHLAQTSDAVNRQLSCFSSRYMNLLAVFQI